MEATTINNSLTAEPSFCIYYLLHCHYAVVNCGAPENMLGSHEAQR